MSEVRKGFVHKVFKNSSKPGSNREWFAYSFKLENENGDVDSTFYQFGFNKEIPFKENDYIQFSATPKDEKAWTVVEGSGKILKNPPKRQSQAQNAGGAKVTASDLFGEIGGYSTEDDIKRITYAGARNAAVQVIGALLEHDALPMSTAKTKAGQSKRFDEINAMIDKKTVEFYFDAANLRKLEVVADAGKVLVEPDAELPDSAEVEQSAEADDGVPPDPDEDGENNDSPSF